MKKIRRISSNPLFLTLLVVSFLFASCSSDNGGGSELTQSLNEQNKKISGEELFKSIVFADGQLTDKLPSLKSISNVDNFSKNELGKYRLMEKEAIEYLKKLNPNYFVKFQEGIYSRDPETISKSIKQIVSDMVPFINGKLSIQNSSIEKIAKNLKKDATGKIDFEKSKGQMKEMCAVYTFGLVAVAVALIWVVAVSAVAVWGNQLQKERSSITLEAISIQTAQSL